MKNQFEINGYKITSDPRFQNKVYGITPELEARLGSLYEETQDKKNKKIVDKLNQLIIQYPKVPMLKNFLSVAFSVQGNFDKAIEVNNWILKEHPNYLFGLINRANKFIEDEEFSKVPEIMGEQMELKALYPDRDLFHLSEVTGFYNLATRYFAAIEDLELAEICYELLIEIAPNHPDTVLAELYIQELLIKRAKTRFDEEIKYSVHPSTAQFIPRTQKTSVPKFNHSEILNLYQFGLAISPSKLNEIMALPRETLVSDLEDVLLDAVERFDYFIKRGWEEEENNFIIHVLWILKEIKAEESLPNVLQFLQYEDEFLEFWLGDHITDNLWQVIYSLGFNQTKLLKDFLLLPGIDTYCKTTVSEALCQMAHHHPERRNEIVAIFMELFEVFSKASPQDNLIDSVFLGLSIADITDYKFHELLPGIKILYDLGYVSPGVSGNYDEVEKLFDELPKIKKTRKFYTIFEFYEYVLSNWSGYLEADEMPFFDPVQQAISNRIGRNEKCPCGSGKKYKKCCLG